MKSTFDSSNIGSYEYDDTPGFKDKLKSAGKDVLLLLGMGVSFPFGFISFLFYFGYYKIYNDLKANLSWEKAKLQGKKSEDKTLSCLGAYFRKDEDEDSEVPLSEIYSEEEVSAVEATSTENEEQSTLNSQEDKESDEIIFDGPSNEDSQSLKK